MRPRPLPRVALITGAARGLGVEIGRQLAERGVHVVLTARCQSDARTAADRLRGRGLPASAARLDVTRPATIEAAVGAVLAAHGRIDVLVNNAGVTDGAGSASTIDPEIAAGVWETNVLGPWHCATAVIPPMRAAGYGRIVNVSSRLGSLATMSSDGDDPSEPAYRVSKAGLNALTRLLAAELAGTGILVNAASPGWVRTDMGGPAAPGDAATGADTPVWLATLPVDGPTGGFFQHRRPVPW